MTPTCFALSTRLELTPHFSYQGCCKLLGVKHQEHMVWCVCWHPSLLGQVVQHHSTSYSTN